MYLLTTWLRSTTQRSSPSSPATTSAARVLPVPLGPANSAVVPRPRALRDAKPHPSLTVARCRTVVDERPQLRSLRGAAGRGRPSAACGSTSRARPSKRCRARSRHACQSGRPCAAAAAAASRSATGRSNTAAASAISRAATRTVAVPAPGRPRSAATRSVGRSAAGRSIRTAPGTVVGRSEQHHRRLDAGQARAAASRPPASRRSRRRRPTPRHRAPPRVPAAAGAARGRSGSRGRSMRTRKQQGAAQGTGRRHGDRREVRALRPVQDDPVTGLPRRRHPRGRIDERRRRDAQRFGGPGDRRDLRIEVAHARAGGGAPARRRPAGCAWATSGRAAARAATGAAAPSG